jgi:hypothetical protein
VHSNICTYSSAICIADAITVYNADAITYSSAIGISHGIPNA